MSIDCHVQKRNTPIDDDDSKNDSNRIWKKTLLPMCKVRVGIKSCIQKTGLLHIGLFGYHDKYVLIRNLNNNNNNNNAPSVTPPVSHVTDPVTSFRKPTKIYDRSIDRWCVKCKDKREQQRRRPKKENLFPGLADIIDIFI